ncbi:MAG: chromosome segregation protein SMC, partial [Aquificota bacterium]|nr:chromosome segregation protein SMC [Aquificota bacterium]
KADHAYVEVHFKNGGAFPVEDDLVVISRKVTGDGRSTFKVNGTTVRERDLKDFLSKAGIYENGYNVVLQGDIVKFLKMTPVERRKVVEDVAGISEYEAKKEKAIKDLAEVDIKIRELKLLLDEIKVQLDRLKEEKEKLDKYRSLEREKRETEVAILSKEIRKLSREEERLSSELKEVQERISSLKERVEKLEEDLKVKEEHLKALNDRLLPFKESVGRISSDIDHVNREIEERTRTKDKLASELNKEERTAEYLKRDLENLTSEIENLKAEIRTREEDLEGLVDLERRHYEELKALDEKLKVSIEEAQRTEEKERQIREHIERLKEEDQRIRISIKEAEVRIEKTEEEIRNLEKEKEDLERRIKSSEKDLEKLRSMKAVEQDILKKEREELKKVEAELKRVRDRIEEVIRAKAYVEGRLSDLEPAENVFGNMEGVYGTVGDLITVKDPEHIRAVEVAGGGRLRFVVVEDEDTAKRCIDFLRENNLGRMSFIPLNRIRVENRLPPLPRVKGVIDFAINLVEYDPRFEKAVRFALGDTVIVDSFETAKKVGIGTYRMVTLDGDLFERSGVITGGSPSPKGDLGRKFYEEERRKLDLEERDLREREQDLVIKMRAIRNEIAEKEGLLKVLERKLTETEELSRRGHEKIEEYRRRIEKAREYLETLREEIDARKRRLEEIKGDLEYSREKLRNLEIKRQDIINHYRSSGIEEKRREYERIKRRVEAKREELNSLRLQLRDRENQIGNIREEIRRREARIEDLREEIRRAEEAIKELQERRSSLENSIKEIEAQVYRIYKERDRTEEEVRNLQAEIGRLRIEEEDLRTRERDISTNLSRVRQKISDLRQRLQEIGFEGELPDVKDPVTKLKERLYRIEREIENLGSVNMKAEEDYKLELERYREYEDRYRTLQEERKAIKSMIEEIETKKLRAFMEAFKSINRSLRRIFSFLSPGGKAQMILENEADPFSGGINLVVKPRGKDVQYLEAMSGGEKTLAALSLIFAIQEYKPSPFYYFDEVDAHLDEANARKVGELIRQKSKEAQFIVVTLREVLASFADRLIGVSARGGVSRVFPVENLSAVLEKSG